MRIQNLLRYILSFFIIRLKYAGAEFIIDNAIASVSTCKDASSCFFSLNKTESLSLINFSSANLSSQDCLRTSITLAYDVVFGVILNSFSKLIVKKFNSVKMFPNVFYL